MNQCKLLKLTLLLSIALLLSACTSEVVSDMTQEGQLIIDPTLAAPSTLSMQEGYTDSVFMTLLVATGQAPELNKNTNPDTFLESTMGRVQKFVLSWDVVPTASSYEIRASHEPITEETWLHALAVTSFENAPVDGVISADIPLTKTQITSGKCTNCGECVKACPFDAISTINGKSVVNTTRCTSCGECYSSCKFDALDGLFAGQAYYFAIRARNSDNTFSAAITATTEPYKLRYTTVASIPDDQKPASWLPQKKGCYGDCGIKYTDNGECESGSCYIVSPPTNQFDPGSRESVCPADAIYSVEDTTAADSLNTTAGAIFIDKDKCINCGRCVIQCQYDGFGSATSEIVRSIQEFFRR